MASLAHGQWGYSYPSVNSVTLKIVRKLHRYRNKTKQNNGQTMYIWQLRDVIPSLKVHCNNISFLAVKVVLSTLCSAAWSVQHIMRYNRSALLVLCGGNPQVIDGFSSQIGSMSCHHEKEYSVNFVWYSSDELMAWNVMRVFFQICVQPNLLFSQKLVNVTWSIKSRLSAGQKLSGNVTLVVLRW